MNIKFSLIVILLITITASLYSQEISPSYLACEEFRISYHSEVYAILVDVRQKKEYRRGHIPGAINVDRMDRLAPFADSLDTETPLYIYCDTYTRSNTVAEYLTKREFSDIKILKNGFLEWKAAGLPIEKRKQKNR